MTTGFKKGVFIAIMLMIVAFLAAQETVEEPSLFQQMFSGPGAYFMYVILFLGVVVMVLAIVKLGKLAVKEKFDAQRFYLKLKGYIKNEQFDEAVKVCSNFKSKTLGFIFWNGLIAFNDARKAGKSGRELRDTLQNAFDEAGLQQIPKITSGLYWFDLFAQIATLLGLLGTIFGLILAFQALANAPEAEKASRLTNGISVAMGTTGFGLIVAIPTMLIKGYLQGRAEQIVNDIDEFSVKTINQIHYTIKD
ncbi:MAG: MotA/TolQ/ExbB proton channel family protein [Candidatus Cloacimonetes bacterium]|nr:MotA/TolQ/ExbB proton channel family protein [Candidatus Cloacimonadota bacterium]